MENKPFDLQSPVKIASEYGGNKQKIAEASKMGIVDPTAALLAGMFIDRMRSAQQAEMTPQQTVAQQVFSPQPPPPPPGAMPQGGPPMPMGGAPMPPPPPPQGGPPMGMAGGGLMSIPVPDAMFDEPDNGGYANGGIVAFAAGDRISFKDSRAGKFLSGYRTKEEEEAARKKFDVGRSQNAANFRNYLSETFGGEIVDVPRGSVDLSAPALAAGAPPANESNEAYAARMNANRPVIGGVAVNPPSAAAPVTARPTAPRVGVPTAPTAPTATTATGDGLDEYNKMLKGGYADRDAAVTDIKKLMGADDARPATDALREANKKALSPEEQKKDREQDMWMTLAQIGAGMAATKSPNFMQAAGESIQAALPGMIADRKARKAEVKDALKEQAALEGMDRQEAREYAKMGLEEYNNYTRVLLQAKELAQRGEIEAARMVLERWKAENENRYQQGSLGVQRAALSKPTAEEADQALFNKDPTAYQRRYTAQYAGRGAAANPFGDRLGTGGGSNGWSLVGTGQ